jgi:hypothetical protein
MTLTARGLRTWPLIIILKVLAGSIFGTSSFCERSAKSEIQTHATHIVATIVQGLWQLEILKKMLTIVVKMRQNQQILVINKFK